MTDTRCRSAILHATEQWLEGGLKAHRETFESLAMDADARPGDTLGSIEDNAKAAAIELLQYPTIFEVGKRTATLVGIDPTKGGFWRETARYGLSIPTSPVGFILGHGRSIWRDGETAPRELGIEASPAEFQAIPRVVAGTIRRVEIVKDVADAGNHYLFNAGIALPAIPALPVGALEWIGRQVTCSPPTEPKGELARRVEQIIQDHPELADEIEKLAEF